MPTVTTAQAALELGVTPSRIRQLCIANRIVGAKKMGRDWTMPSPVKLKKKSRRKAKRGN